jgi:hypothetical protein
MNHGSRISTITEVCDSVIGADPLLDDGVYVLIRVPSQAAGRTIGVAPKHDERFAHFKLTPDQDLDEVADFIAACASAQ